MNQWEKVKGCLVFTLIFGMAASVWGQEPGTADNNIFRQQIEELEKGQQAILEDLKAIKEVLAARVKHDDIALNLDVGEAPVQGQADAPDAGGIHRLSMPLLRAAQPKVLPQLGLSSLLCN